MDNRRIRAEVGRVKSILISFILPVILVSVITFGCNRVNSSDMYMCKHQYALCTSAKCVPQPGDPTKTVCFCEVYEGKSMSTLPCKNLRPSTDKNGIQTVYSTFSLKQYQGGKKGMKCPEGTPWSCCLNKRCTVDPTNPKKTICVCDMMRSGEWMTLGGNCDASTCDSGYWSGATLKSNEKGSSFMIKKLGLEKSPVKWCPI